MRANGSYEDVSRVDRMYECGHTFDFFSSEWVVGIVFRVHRRYLLDSLANSDGVTAAFEGRLIGGGGL
jgi:hypothetical protein